MLSSTVSTVSTVTLFMIVKNESRIIERCLTALKSHVDFIVISDTGSTDDTVKKIENFLTTHNIRGKVYHDEWRNFGYNRTKSFQNMQHFLEEEKIDASRNYGLTVDADMCLHILNPNYRQTLSASHAWQVKQKSPNLEYWNSRLFRSDLPFECIGVTHEYWGCNQVQGVGQQNHDLIIEDVGDGGSKADKFERDIRLLSKGLEDDPKNERYMFYLANSYKDSQNYEEAIKWYKKRIESGSWYEEVYISWCNLGSCYEKLNKPEHAIEAWIQAFNQLPKRSESLYKIAKHYRLSGKNHASLLYVRQGLKIPFPQDLVLFLETNVYKFLFIEELSIIAFYTGMKRAGRLACQYLMMAQGIPDSQRNQAKSNNYFYLEKLSAEDRIHRLLSIPTRHPYVSSSASLLREGNRLIGNVRAVNYSMDDKFNYTTRDSDNIVRTINYWCEFDLIGNLISCNELVETDLVDKKHIVNVRGLEDMRICKLGDKYYGIAVDREYCAHPHPSILFCEISNNQISKTIPIKFRDHTTQKNWTIFTKDEKIFLCYGHHPFTLLEVNPHTGETQTVCEKPTGYHLPDIRGSANPVRLEDENAWLFLVHEVAWKDTRKYFHRFLKYNDNWDLVMVSEPFYFNHLYVEFCLSVCLLDDEKIAIPFSTKDNSTEILTIDLKRINWMNISEIPSVLSNI